MEHGLLQNAGVFVTLVPQAAAAAPPTPDLAHALVQALQNLSGGASLAAAAAVPPKSKRGGYRASAAAYTQQFWNDYRKDT